MTYFYDIKAQKRLERQMSKCDRVIFYFLICDHLLRLFNHLLAMNCKQHTEKEHKHENTF